MAHLVCDTATRKQRSNYRRILCCSRGWRSHRLWTTQKGIVAERLRHTKACRLGRHHLVQQAVTTEAWLHARNQYHSDHPDIFVRTLPNWKTALLPRYAMCICCLGLG